MRLIQCRPFLLWFESHESYPVLCFQFVEKKRIDFLSNTGRKRIKTNREQKSLEVPTFILQTQTSHYAADCLSIKLSSNQSSVCQMNQSIELISTQNMDYFKAKSTFPKNLCHSQITREWDALHLTNAISILSSRRKIQNENSDVALMKSTIHCFFFLFRFYKFFLSFCFTS